MSGERELRASKSAAASRRGGSAGPTRHELLGVRAAPGQGPPLNAGRRRASSPFAKKIAASGPEGALVQNRSGRCRRCAWPACCQGETRAVSRFRGRVSVVSASRRRSFHARNQGRRSPSVCRSVCFPRLARASRAVRQVPSTGRRDCSQGRGHRHRREAKWFPRRLGVAVLWP